MGAKVIHLAYMVCAGIWALSRTLSSAIRATWGARAYVLTSVRDCPASTSRSRNLPCRTLMLAALVPTLCCAGMSGSASARARAPAEAALEVEVVPDAGEPVPPAKITATVVGENKDYTGGREEESGMTVSRLATLVGVAPEQLRHITVTDQGIVSYEMEGQEAIHGKTVSGSAYYAVFRDLGIQLDFVYPPKEAGEVDRIHEVPGPAEGPLRVVLQVKGGLLKVSPLAFSPLEPEAGVPVSFAAPKARAVLGGQVTDLKYLWQFEDGKSSEDEAPEHPFEPEKPKIGTYHYDVKVVVTGAVSYEGSNVTVTGSRMVPVPVKVTKEEEHHNQEGDEEQEGTGGNSPNGGAPSNGATGGSGTGPKQANPNGPPSGSVNTPSIGVEPSRNSKTSHKAGLSFGGGSGGAVHSSGHGSPSSGSGPGSSAVTRSGSGSGKAVAEVGASSVQSEHTDAPQQSASPHAGISPALVGVLLGSDGGRLPAAILASDTSPAQSSTASLPDAAPGSPGDGGPIGLLRWALGILAVVIIVSAGGLAELQPRARYRRLAGG